MRDLVFPGSHRVPFLSSGSWEMAMTVIASLLLFGSTLGLRRKPAAMAAALLSLLAFSVLFAQFYPGGYRHEALWLVFLVSLYWMTFQSAPEPPWPQPDASVRVGTLAFVLLLGIQLSGTVLKVADVVSGAPPSSRARDFAGFMRTHPEFSDSVVLADPEYLLDTVSHYARNRTYLMRQQRYGRFALFTRSARQRLSLQEILNIASQIRADSGKPVLILLSFRLARIDGTGSRRPEITRAGSYAEGYSWKLDVTPDQIDRFLDATELLVEYPPALTDESFDVYVLR